MFATLDDVSTRLGRPITDPDEVAQVTAWIGDVEALVVSRIPDLETRVAEGAPSAGVVAMVVANAVIRKVKNPEGYVSAGVDDFNYRYNEAARKGELFLTDEEWRLLVPSQGSGVFSVRPSFEADYSYPSVWLS